MPTYITLANFTDQGVRNAKDTVKRAEAFKDLAKKHGVTVKDVYWAQGRYDIVTISEAADEMAATALALSIGGQGNIPHRDATGLLRRGHEDHYWQDGIGSEPAPLNAKGGAIVDSRS